jgi:hypothetical protein
VTFLTPQLRARLRRVVTTAARVVAFALVLLRIQEGIVASRTLAQDGIVYIAAGERLNAGHRLYALLPSDRPILLNPPFYDSPFVSPPFTAVPFRALALLPTDFVLGLWWVVCFVAMAAVLLWFAWRLPVPTALLTVLLGTPIVFQLGHGNNQSLVLVGTIATWRLATTSRERAAGWLTGLLTVVKLFPAMLVVWAAAGRRWAEVAAAIVATIILTIVSALFAGPSSFVEFLGTHVSPTRVSLPGWLMGVGMSSTVAIVSVLVVGLLVVVALGRWPDLSFVAAVLVMTYAPPAVNAHSQVLVFAILAPVCWPIHRRAGATDRSPNVTPAVAADAGEASSTGAG